MSTEYYKKTLSYIHYSLTVVLYHIDCHLNEYNWCYMNVIQLTKRLFLPTLYSKAGCVDIYLGYP